MTKTTTTTFTYYTFRFDYLDNEIKTKVLSYIKSEFPKYALFDEVSEVVGKDHIQGKIGKAMSIEQIRKKFHLNFPKLFNRSNYSIALIKDADEWDSYICKDGKPLLNNVFDDEYIQAQVSKREDNKKKYKEKVVKSKSALTFTQKISAEFKTEYAKECETIQRLAFHDDYYASDQEKELLLKSQHQLLKFILLRLGGLVKVFDQVVLQRMYNAVKLSISHDNPDGLEKATKYFENRIQM